MVNALVAGYEYLIAGNGLTDSVNDRIESCIVYDLLINAKVNGAIAQGRDMKR